jgi:L,D-transpeptidase YcbB
VKDAVNGILSRPLVIEAYMYSKNWVENNPLINLSKVSLIISLVLLIHPVSGSKVQTTPATILEKSLIKYEPKGKSNADFQGKRVYDDLRVFYANRNFEVAWIINGNPRQGAHELIGTLKNCRKEGLNPEDYPIDSLVQLLHQKKKNYFWRIRLDSLVAVQLDLLLSKTYFSYANHLLFGWTQPKMPTDSWHISPEPISLPNYLKNSLSANHNIGASLHSLSPKQPEYEKLKYWLTYYQGQDRNQPWPLVPSISHLDSLKEKKSKSTLCLRLQAEGYLPAGSCLDLSNKSLLDGLNKFKVKHGLADDEKLDQDCLRELNVSLSDRIQQIQISLNNWRWLPQKLGDNHVRINIADFRLGAFEKGKQIFSMKVVVGRKSDSTPVFNDLAIAVILNPPWNVPGSIAKEEILPELKKNPNYLSNHGMELLSDRTKEETILRADSIDWSQVDTNHFEFRIRQKFGESSALGRIKINLENPFNIYLHDTPSKQYFERDKRALSHGCIRLEHPLKLAEWLLGPDSKWSQKNLSSEISKGQPLTIAIQEPGIPVYILYQTAFIDTEGGLQFRPDIYGWDKDQVSSKKNRTPDL